MNLKNYTSSVPVVNSINKIEHRLVSAGATHIVKMYDYNERPTGISFQINVNDLPHVFKLPAKVEKVFEVLWKEVRRPRPGTKKNVEMQAQRTAWKLLSDWVEVQVSLLKIEQIELFEAFLPYHYDIQHDQTLYQKIKAGGFKQLNQANK